MIAEYLGKQALFRPAIAAPPAANLGLVVVIPAKDEPALARTLASLEACECLDGAAEVIVVGNGSVADDVETRRRNAAGVTEARSFAASHGGAKGLSFHVLEHLELPERHAGVGLARKIGMDEALRRFGPARAGGGIIACLDGDCTVTPDYLREIDRWFTAHPSACAATIHFEHRFEQLDDPRHRAGIVGYELFLRAHVHGLSLAGVARAHQTVGSSIAVRADAYAAVGGMNRRKAGEDFYFVQKLAAYGEIGVIGEATVFPSARVSDRVPFGTGRAMGDWLSSDAAEIEAYDPRVYREVAEVLTRGGTWFTKSPSDATKGLSTPVATFLELEGIVSTLTEIRANTASPESFRRRVADWMNTFRILKLIHHLTRVGYPKVPVTRAARELLAWEGLVISPEVDAEALLAIYRRLDRRAGERNEP